MSKKPTPEWEKISPTIAEKLLEKNTSNRALSQLVVDRYAAEMKRGEWDESNGETIKIADDGTIIDGQHRLWAIFESGKTLQFLVVRGVDKDAFKTIDIGKTRSIGDVVGIAGIPNANQAVAGAMVILAYRKKKITLDASNMSKHFLRSEVFQFCVDHQDDLQVAVRGGMQHGCAKLLGPAALVGLHYLFTHVSKVDHARTQADAFFQQLGSGLFDARYEGQKHPIRILREKLIDNKTSVSRMPTGALIALVIKTWNAYVTSRSVGVLRMTSGESFPVIV